MMPPAAVPAAISTIQMSLAAAAWFGLPVAKHLPGKRRRRLRRELARERRMARVVYRLARGHHQRWMLEASGVSPKLWTATLGLGYPRRTWE